MDKLLHDILDPGFLTCYVLLSIYASAILLYEGFDDKPIMSRKNTVTRILMGFSPGYNVIVTFFWTVFKIVDIIHCYFKAKDKSEEEIFEARQKHVFGFLKYKGIELSELDEYIDSRSLMGKMIDKIQ